MPNKKCPICAGEGLDRRTTPLTICNCIEKKDDDNEEDNYEHDFDLGFRAFQDGVCRNA